MHHLRRALCSLALAAAVGAQSLEEGYSGTVRSLPAVAGNVSIVDDGSVVYFTGTDLILDDGSSTTSLLSFMTPVFGSFTIQVSPTELLFGESSNGDLWLVPLTGGSGSPRVLANLTFNFAATAYDANYAMVSAKTGGFAAVDNDVVAVDLRTGALDQIARVPGASGPLVVDDVGNLYYGTASNAFPAPAGSADILRFDAAAVAGAFGPSELGIGDAEFIYRGLDAAGSLALDGRGDLFVVDWANSRVVEVNGIDRPSPELTVLADYAAAAVSPSAVQFAGAPRGAGAQVFEPFQPQGAGPLTIHESAYGSASQVRFVEPARPTTTVSSEPVPPGPFSIATTGGPANGMGCWAVAPSSVVGPEIPFFFGGFDQPLFWSLNRGSLSLVWPAVFDGAGTQMIQLSNPGPGAPVALASQVLFANASGRVIGSAAAVGFTLQ